MECHFGYFAQKFPKNDKNWGKTLFSVTQCLFSLPGPTHPILDARRGHKAKTNSWAKMGDAKFLRSFVSFGFGFSFGFGSGFDFGFGSGEPGPGHLQLQLQ